MSIIAERTEVTAPTSAACEATVEFFGIELPCVMPSIGLYRRICVHEHVREGRLCREHVDLAPVGRCLACFLLDGDLSHDCPINLAEVTA